MGLNGSIVHFDKRQKLEAWRVSLGGEKVCSIDWNRSNNLIATGDNFSFLNVFDIRKIERGDPLYKFQAQATIKALQWNPVKPNLLAIGGGIADKHMYLIDLEMQRNICKKDVKFQVCDLTWLDEEHFVIGAGFSSGDQEKLSAWHYRKEIQTIKNIGYMAGKGRALNIVKNPRFAQILAHCADQGDHIIYVWKLENTEETKYLERIQHQEKASMQWSFIR